MATTITLDVFVPNSLNILNLGDLNGTSPQLDINMFLQTNPRKNGRKRVRKNLKIGPLTFDAFACCPKCREANPMEFAHNDPKHSPAKR